MEGQISIPDDFDQMGITELPLQLDINDSTCDYRIDVLDSPSCQIRGRHCSGR